MNAVKLFMAELKALFQRNKVLSSILVVLVPLIFVGVLLSPDWGPYDNLDNLPVAVVNNDEGSENNGESLNVGSNLVENLKGSDTLGWDFVSEDEANRGLKDMKYFMVIEIPENFSENVTSVLSDNPTKAELKFTRNEGLHFMAAQVTNNAIDTVKSQLSAEVTETYVRSLFGQLGGVGEGFQDASDGSNQIYDGTVQLKDGTTQLLDALVGGSENISALANGAGDLKAGTEELLGNLQGSSSDVARLAAGAQQLNAGTGEILTNLQGSSGDVARLAAGAKDLNDGTGLLLSTLRNSSSNVQQLADGAQGLKDGTVALQAGANQVSGGLEDAKDGSESLINGLVPIVGGFDQVYGGVQLAKKTVVDTMDELEQLKEQLESTLANTDPSDPTSVQALYGTIDYVVTLLDEKLDSTDTSSFDTISGGVSNLKGYFVEKGAIHDGLVALDNGLSQLVAGQSAVSAGADNLAAGAGQVADGTHTVNAGWNEIIVNVERLHGGATQIREGNQTVAQGWNALTDGATQLNAGASELSAGNQTVNEGWQKLTQGATQLNDGALQISDGNKTVEDGWASLTDGVTQVDGGLIDLQSGANELATGLTSGAEATSQLNASDETISMFASPVALNGEVINSFQFYRDSSAPYVMSLALFAGIVALSFVIPFTKPEEMPESGASWFISKFLNLSVFAVSQAVIISLFALLVLKVQVQSALLFIMFAIGVSLVFLMIVLFLVSLAGNLGRFLALAVIVLQLSITGSSLPIQMLPEFFRDLSVFLPLTYTIDGFRSIVSLGNFSNVFANGGVLFLFFAGFGIAAFLVFLVKFRGNKVTEEDLLVE